MYLRKRGSPLFPTRKNYGSINSPGRGGHAFTEMAVLALMLLAAARREARNDGRAYSDAESTDDS